MMALQNTINLEETGVTGTARHVADRARVLPCELSRDSFHGQ